LHRATDVIRSVAQVIDKHGKDLASSQVVGLEQGQQAPNPDELMVVERSGEGMETTTNPTAGQLPTNISSTNAKISTVRFLEKTCSCDRWQEHLYPCRHAIACLRQWGNKQFFEIPEEDVHPYYKYDSLNMIYQRSIRPVSSDYLEHDGETNNLNNRKRWRCDSFERNFRNIPTIASIDPVEGMHHIEAGN